MFQNESVDVDPKEIKGILSSYLLEHSHDLSDLPYGFAPQASKDLDINVTSIRYAIKRLRKERGIIKNPPKEISIDRTTDIQDCLLSNGLIRSSNKEGIACDIIIQTLLKRIPWGGSGMLIGTPTAFCASPHQTNKRIITDNYAVALALQWTTIHPLEIVVGNAIDEEKAKLKASHWKSIDMLNPKVTLDIVDRDSFSYYVTKFALKSEVSKVILLTSGPWSCSRSTMKKRGLESKFDSPSQFLTKKFRNLHILAMCMDRNGMGFHVKYLHNCNEEIIRIPNVTIKKKKFEEPKKIITLCKDIPSL